MEKRLIEVDFPLEEVSKESAREKYIRHGHISTLHIWWARRPLASSRATTYAALIPAPENDNELKKKLDFIAKLSKWESSLNKNLIEKARKDIRDFFGDRSPKVLDCFSGGGAIPLEALRLGCETYALEYNPVAIIILKSTLEFPQMFGNLSTKANGELLSTTNPLLKDVEKWGEWVFKEAEKELERFYPPDRDENRPVGYIWARTIRCQNPSCKVEIPLMRQLWLAKNDRNKIAVKLIVDKNNKNINFKIFHGNEIDFDPSLGTTRRATVLCPVCETGIDSKTVRNEAKQGRMGQRLVVLVLRNSQRKGKTYRISVANDLKVFQEAEKYLENKRQELFNEWGFSPVPNEEIPLMTGTFNVPLYGLSSWGDLFNSRQKLAMITFVEKVRKSYERMESEGYALNYIKAIMTYLALIIDRLADKNSNLVVYNVVGEKIEHVFGRQALPMVWDYVEVNPFTNVGWPNMKKWVLKVIDHCSQTNSTPIIISQSSATSLSYTDNYFDAVITDPPYYINVPYADLSDFFYVWLKRTIGDLYPNLFATPLTPKSLEIGQMKHWDKVRYSEKDKAWFEFMLKKSFSEIQRVLKSSGICVIVFAHKSTEAWETIINALLQSGLVLTASWPIHTEMRARLRARGSATLASSVYMVCRKRTKEEITYFNEIREEIDNRIKEKLTQFWEQGISGADFFVSAIGPAVEVFGQYSRVERLSGEEVTVKELLEYVRKIVSEFALERVLKRSDLGGVDAETRFYLLWRWTFGNAKVPFDDGIKLSRPMGIELTDIWDRGELIKKEKEYVRVLGPKEREKDENFLRKKRFTSMIDVLHRVLISWDKGERQDINEILVYTGYLKNEIFWQTAQALSEILPEGDKEKQLIQGFLYGRETYFKEEKRDKTLFEFMEERKE